MLTEIDLDRNNNAYQAEQQAQKEKERQELNKYCADSKIPSECKAEAIVDFQIKWGLM
jgi:hypothetical protein